MTPLERLRLAVALTHSVPGAELTLRTPLGEPIVVGVHPEASIDPCAMRNVVIASSCPSRPNLAERISSVELGGALEDLGGGVYRVMSAGREQRWIASVLQPERITELLDSVGLDSVPADSMHGCLKPDAQLGVSILIVTSNDGQFDAALDDIAAQAAGAFFAEELLVSLNSSNQHVGGAQ